MKAKDSLVIGYWEYAPLEDLHQHSNIWLSEILFTKDEIDFMIKLVNQHFSSFSNAKWLNQSQHLAVRIEDSLNTIRDLEDKIHIHEKRLKRLIESPDKKVETDYRREHGILQIQMDEFQIQYKNIKSRLFQEANAILEEEGRNPKHLT